MRFVRPIVVCAVAILLAACAPAQVPPPLDADLTAKRLEPLAPSAKRAEIASSFPIEVPVVSGEVTRGQAQGTDAWDYEVSVASPPQDVVTWYRNAYAGRNWVLQHEWYVDGPQGGGTELTFRKGDAESRVTVSGTAENTSIVRAVLGVGAPVLDTQ